MLAAPCFVVSICLEGGESGEIFAYDVEFEIDDGSRTDVREVRMLECVGDNRHAESI